MQATNRTHKQLLKVAAVASLVLISLIAGLQAVKLAEANPTQTPTAAQRPTISILNPRNDSFFNVSLGGVHYQLTYETNSTLSWVGYSLNSPYHDCGGYNETVNGNSTFVHDLVSSSGYYTLTVYANGTSGNWADPQTVTYLVNFYPDYTPPSSPSPSFPPLNDATPTPLPAATMPEFSGWMILPLAAVIALAAAIIVKRKKPAIGLGHLFTLDCALLNEIKCCGLFGFLHFRHFQLSN